MNLADKIMTLRRQQGWSQETLAEKLDVTRQSVSKWESAQSVPDLDKILALSELFGVTTDYLLKDNDSSEAATSSDTGFEASFGNRCAEIPAQEVGGTESVARLVDLPEAKEFLDLKRRSASWIAGGVSACILCPVPLMFLGSLAAEHVPGVSEDSAGAVGVILLLAMVAAAVAVFIRWGMKLQPYEYLEKEEIRVEEAARVLAKKERKADQKAYSVNNIVGVVLCILSAVPILAMALLPPGTNDFVYLFGVCMTLTMIAIAVNLFIRVGIPRGAQDMLLQEGDYTVEKKAHNKWAAPISGAYWLIVTAIFLAISLGTGSWERSWIIWPVAGVLFGALMLVCGMIKKK